MIKVKKDFDDIPPSLLDNTTQRHRQKCINASAYVESDRYKKDDTKKLLKEIYHNKCCYCEQSIGDNYQQVEHFRPKAVYYWLAHSWDNLFLCCDRCNGFKSDTFGIDGAQARYQNETGLDIHHLEPGYRVSEKPQMINPEQEDVESLLEFDRSGSVSSKDSRVQYTITTCKVDRPESNYKRKKLLDSLLKKISLRRRENRESEIIGLVKDFKNESMDSENEYLAFRRWVLRNLSSGIL